VWQGDTNALVYIDTELDYKNNAFALDNPLITLKPPKPPKTRVDRLETIINQLQEPNCDWRLRLAQGAYYYEKLAALVQDRTKAADRPFLYQMLPAFAGCRRTSSRRFSSRTPPISASTITRTTSWPATWTRCSRR
jgi:hypothetical protein